MEDISLKDIFIAPMEVINRAPNSISRKIFGNTAQGYGGGGGCQCVNCQSCDNGCNK